MKLNKAYIILIGIFCVYIMGIVGYVIFKNNIKTNYLIVDDIAAYKLDKNSFKNVNFKNIEFDKIKFNIYNNNIKYYNYNLTYSDKFNIFDENHNWKDVNQNMLAVNSDIDFKILDYTVRTVNEKEEEYIKSIIKEKIDYYTSLETNEVIESNDSKNSYKLVNVSNAITNDLNYDKVLFNLIYIEKNNKKTILLLEYFDVNKLYDYPLNAFYNIINIDNKNTYLMIHKSYLNLEKNDLVTIYDLSSRKIKQVN